MSIRMMSGLPLRVATVLQDYLTTELALIDAEEADGLTTPTIAAADYYLWDQQVIPNFPACSLRPVSSSPLQVYPAMDAGGSRRVDVEHRIDVMFHLTPNETTVPLTMQAYLFRYISGAMRVLCVRYESLQTVADPTRFVELCEWSGPAIYGPDQDQEDGAIVRTATLPITIRRIEVR